jgi:hypothetical protein
MITIITMLKYYKNEYPAFAYSVVFIPQLISIKNLSELENRPLGYPSSGNQKAP